MLWSARLSHFAWHVQHVRSGCTFAWHAQHFGSCLKRLDVVGVRLWWLSRGTGCVERAAKPFGVAGPALWLCVARGACGCLKGLDVVGVRLRGMGSIWCLERLDVPTCG